MLILEFKLCGLQISQILSTYNRVTGIFILKLNTRVSIDKLNIRMPCVIRG